VQPALEGAICAALGPAPAGQWLHYVLDTDAKSPILFFRYPTAQWQGFPYLISIPTPHAGQAFLKKQGYRGQRRAQNCVKRRMVAPQ
jgi:hypothetical protein